MATESKTGSREESLEAQIATLKADLAALSTTIADMVKSGAGDYVRQGREQAEAAVDSAYAYGEALEEKITKNPLAAVLVALGLGFLVGLLSRR